MATREAQTVASAEASDSEASQAVERAAERVRAAAADPAAVDELCRQLEWAARTPSRALANTMHRLLADRTLCAAVDSKGVSAETTLLAKLVSLGFPYALELSPEQLVVFRAVQTRSAEKFAAVAGLSSLVANALFAVVLLGAGWPDGLLFSLSAAHGVAVFVESRRSPKRRAVLRLLGAFAWVAASLVVGAALLASRLSVAWWTLVAILPTVVTCFAAWRLAARLPESPPVVAPRTRGADGSSHSITKPAPPLHVHERQW